MIQAVLYVIAAHWFCDFVLQTHWQASNKSKNWIALFRHVAVYSFAMMWLLSFIALPLQGDVVVSISFFGITFIAHFLTDAVTSRITSRLYKAERWHDFFVIIGFDQVLHYAQLFLTLKYATTMLDGL